MVLLKSFFKLPFKKYNITNISCIHTIAKESYRNPKGEKFSMTKIVGTIGPVSESKSMTQELANEGLRIMRINFSHATYEEADLRMKNLRSCRGVHSTYGKHFNLRAVLLDTQGPEIRCGTLINNEKIQLKAGNNITLTTNNSYRLNSSDTKLYITYSKLYDTVKINDTILLDDGLIHLTVINKDTTNKEIICRIQNTEILGSRKGVNLPGLQVDLPALTDKDKEHIAYGVKNDIDFVAASFVRKPQDVIDIRNFIKQEMIKNNYELINAPKIISKIENEEGITNFDKILELSDGIMVARGDLGVEIPVEKVLTWQKYMVDQCNHVGKPVIVATQMLESMIRNPRPTRAEVSDVGNAVLDGADCVMLSGEMAQGKYPVESVRTMMKIIKEAELYQENDDEHYIKSEYPSTDVESLASSAVKTAHELNAKLIIVLTDTGYTARMIAKYRPLIPVMCYASSQKVGRQLQIHRSLYPIVAENSEYNKVTFTDAIKNAKELGWLNTGDKVILLNAEELSEHLGTQIMMRLAQVQ